MSGLKSSASNFATVILIATLAVIALVGPARAASDDGCPTPSDEIVTDRPNTTNSSIVVPYGSFQVESGVTYNARKGSDVIDGSETRLRLGVAHCTELTLDVPDYFYAPDGAAASGFSDVKLGVKRQLPQLPGDFTLSAIGGLSFPTGANKVAGPGYNPFIQFPWSRDIASGWSVSGMFTVTWFTSQPPLNPTFEPTFAIGREFGPKSDAVVEYVGDYNHQWPSQVLDTGAVYRVTEHQQVDFQAGFGLNSASLHHFFGVGYSFRIDGLY